MDKKSKVLIWVFLSLIAGAVVFSFSRYFILRDYFITAEAPCDPETEKCFIYNCDPESEECPEDPAEQTSYYKLITKKAYNIPLCDPNDENCEALVCVPEEDCEEILCDEESAEEGAECSDPEEYKAQEIENDESSEMESSPEQDLPTDDPEAVEADDDL